MSEEQPGLGLEESQEAPYNEQQEAPYAEQQEAQYPQEYPQETMHDEDMAYPGMQDPQQYGYYDEDTDRRSAPAEHSDQQQQPQQHGDGPALGKIFVGGVSWQTNENSLRNHFEKFGELDDVALMTDKRTGQPRGFGFVTFKDSSVVDVVLQQEHVVDGRTVDVKRAVPKDEAPAPTRLESKKVFVGGLAPTVTETEFREYFEAYGPVKEAIVMYDRQTNRSRGFGFVTFDNEEAVNKVMKDRQHEIMGKFVEVKRAEPRDARSSDRGGDRGGHGGDRDDMYGGMGMYGGRYASMYGGPMRYPYGYGAPGRGGAPGGAAAAAAAAPGQYPGFGAMGYYGGFPAAYSMGYGGAAGARGMYGYGGAAAAGGRSGPSQGSSGREGSQERRGGGDRDYRDDRGGRSSQPRGGSGDRGGAPQGAGYRGMMGMMPMGYGYGYGAGYGAMYGGPRPGSGAAYPEAGYGASRGNSAAANRAERSFRPY